jgi:hypothetical protein
VREDVRPTVQRLHTEEALRADPIEAGKMQVVGTSYDLDGQKANFSNDVKDIDVKENETPNSRFCEIYAMLKMPS